MPSNAAPTDHSSDLRWETLFAYEKALRGFMAAKEPALPVSVLARLPAMDARTTPPPRFIEIEGLDLGFRRYDADSNVQLVLIHGAGCYGDQFHTMASRIAASGKAQVYTLDMRGHGLSEGARGHAVEYPGQIVNDVEHFLRLLRRRHPKSSLVLGGHSAGGGVVLGVSRTAAQDLLSGYLFLSPYLGLGSETVRPHFGGWTHIRGHRLRAIVAANLLHITGFNNQTVVDFSREICRLDPRLVRSWSFNTMMSFGAGRWLPDAAPISPDRPVLLLAGKKDECFVQPLYRQALDVIAPHADMPTVGDLGHWDILTDETAIASVEQWLDENFEGRFLASLGAGIVPEITIAAA